MNNWRVLIVEDEPDGQEVVKGILEHFNIATNAVGTAEEAVEALQYDRYNAVVIDLALPGMDGMQLIDVIRRNRDTAALPCMAVTAFHASAVKQQVLEAGFDSYLPKPINDAVFVKELDRIITGS
jgi:two-component system capsular synthesis sensor histidine kinase RcsC